MGRVVPTNSSAAEASAGGNGDLGSVGSAAALELPDHHGAGVPGVPGVLGTALPRGERIGAPLVGSGQTYLADVAQVPEMRCGGGEGSWTSGFYAMVFEF